MLPFREYACHTLNVPKNKAQIFIPNQPCSFSSKWHHQPPVAQASILTVVTSDRLPRSGKYQMSSPLTAMSCLQAIIISLKSVSGLQEAPLGSTSDAAA